MHPVGDWTYRRNKSDEWNCHLFLKSKPKDLAEVEYDLDQRHVFVDVPQATVEDIEEVIAILEQLKEAIST